MLELLVEQYGLKVTPKPIIAKDKAVSKYPVGTLRELATFIMKCPADQVVEINYDALTQANISTLHQMARGAGYHLHCIRFKDKRILWMEFEFTGGGLPDRG